LSASVFDPKRESRTRKRVRESGEREREREKESDGISDIPPFTSTRNSFVRNVR